MTKVRLALAPGIGTHNKVEVNGSELSSFVRSLRLTMTAGGTPEIDLEVPISECEINAEGVVRLSGMDIPNELAQRIYETLKIQLKKNKEP